MIRGIHQVVLEVEDQDRALDFWTKTMGFDSPRTRRTATSAGLR